MGLTIHYSCSLSKASDLIKLVEEVKDICKTMGCEYHVWNENNLHQFHEYAKEKWTPKDLYGISFSIPLCEPFWLTFLPNLKLSSFVNLIALDDPGIAEILYVAHTNTQLAGP